MYQVNFYLNSQLINTFEFGTKHKAKQCLIFHANRQHLNIREDNYYASTEGNFRECEIEIVQYS